MEIMYKVVTVKHQGCNTPYTFTVPESLELSPGNFVLCETSNHNLPQVAQCMTPSFKVSEVLLKEMYKLNPKQMKPVVGILTPTMYFFRKTGEGE